MNVTVDDNEYANKIADLYEKSREVTSDASSDEYNDSNLENSNQTNGAETSRKRKSISYEEEEAVEELAAKKQDLENNGSDKDESDKEENSEDSDDLDSKENDHEEIEQKEENSPNSPELKVINNKRNAQDDEERDQHDDNSEVLGKDSIHLIKKSK
jgi:hypothetical protein